MKLITRIAFATLLTTGFSITAQAADVKAAPAPAQDPIVQHLKLTNDQVAKIKSLHQQLESNVQQISQQEIKDGALINVIDSGKWDEKAVNDQLAVAPGLTALVTPFFCFSSYSLTDSITSVVTPVNLSAKRAAAYRRRG